MVQRVKDGGTVGADIEDLVALQIEVVVDGFCKHLLGTIRTLKDRERRETLGRRLKSILLAGGWED
jgi:hypothetical protein